MTMQQKKAATALSLLIVLGASLLLLWLAIFVASGHAQGDKLPARMFMLAIANWDGLAIMLKLLPAILSVGLAFLGAYKLKDPLFYAVVGTSVLGLVATAYLFMEISAVATAKTFWAYSPVSNLEDYQSFVGAAQKGLGVVGGWFVTIILAELGIKALSPP